LMSFDEAGKIKYILERILISMYYGSENRVK
jgi:hypothetical protein